MSEDAKPKKKSPSTGASYSRWSWKKVLLTTLCVLLILYVLAGGINQVATGQSIIEWTTNMGEMVGDVLVKIFNNEGVVQVTEDGVYLDGAVPPDGSAL